MSNDFNTALKAFGNKMVCIHCTPTKKKRRGNRNSMLRSQSSLSNGDFVKFVLRFSSKENVKNSSMSLCNMIDLLP